MPVLGMYIRGDDLEYRLVPVGLRVEERSVVEGGGGGGGMC